jgi:hypothetical protein
LQLVQQRDNFCDWCYHAPRNQALNFAGRLARQLHILQIVDDLQGRGQQIVHGRPAIGSRAYHVAHQYSGLPRRWAR